MPIRADLRHFYAGPEWEATRERILERAGYKCEQCGKPDRALVHTFTLRIRMFWSAGQIRKSSTVWMDQNGQLAEPRKMGAKGIPHRIVVILAVVHLNHTAGEDSDDNLRAFCQWCHLNYDKLHHRVTRSIRKDRARPLLKEALS